MGASTRARGTSTMTAHWGIVGLSAFTGAATARYRPSDRRSSATAGVPRAASTAMPGSGTFSSTWPASGAEMMVPRVVTTSTSPV